MDMPKLMAAAAEGCLAVAEQVTPAHLDHPTPCAGWTVRDLVNHLAHWTSVVSERTARKLPRPEDELERDYVDTEPWPDFYRDHLRASVQAWQQPGALDGSAVMLTSALPTAQIALMLFADLVTHGWDLATALGVEYEVDPEVAAAALTGIAGMAERGRQHGAFGAELPPRADASPLDRALALSGRDPHWRPARRANA
ncbi:TIGR03086 family metal-binding protein [Actinokineospora pegani]|uniref:TIGR03086 family metal-binding protein n=1 Tax=Actinokineospora pegani TaxID=2654637 RepID=UPI0012E9D366|nr:TIGR03086 family metal-binding protein [Actinokineospora pegani]